MSEWRQTELGRFPIDWEYQPLKEYLDLITYGFTNPMPTTEEGPYMITAKDINNGRIMYEDARHTSIDAFVNDLTNKSKPKINDVLITKDGSIGRVAIVDKEQICINQSVALLRPKQNIRPLFLKYLLETPVYQKKINIDSDGSTIKHIYITRIDKMWVSIPCIEEQDRILQILANLDRKIDNLRRQNETLEKIAQTLFKHWFIDFEFPNDEGKPYKSSGGAMVASELGDIPAGWRVGKLGDVVDLNAKSITKNYPYQVIEYVDISSVSIGELEGTTTYKLSDAPSRARRLVKHGDTIWSGVRPNRKSYLFIHNPPSNLVVSTGFIVLTPNLIPSSYLYSWVTTEEFVKYLAFNADGSAYPAVSVDRFAEATILLPSPLELDKFHKILNCMRDKIANNNTQIQTLTKTRDTLLPKLMSGQIRVKEGESIIE